jgi:hypothetical protein
VIVGFASRPLAVALALSLLCPSLAAQEQEDVSVTVTPTQTGAVYDLKIGVDGLLVSESYILTRLTCRKTDKLVDVLMPITRADAEGQDGSTLRRSDGGWRLTFKAGKKKIDKAVTFVPITDKISLLAEGTSTTITHGDVVWKGLIATGDDMLLALSGGYGEYVSVFDGKELRAFETACGLKR